MKALWVQVIEHYLVFQYVKGRCHSNQLILVKFHKRQLMTLAFFALSLKNELLYHCLYVHSDMAILCKNLVNFCRVTSEMMEFI